MGALHVFVAGHVKTIFDAQKTLKKRGGDYLKCPCIINGTMNSSISDHRIKINGGKTKEKEPYDSLYLFFFYSLPLCLSAAKKNSKNHPRTNLNNVYSLVSMRKPENCHLSLSRNWLHFYLLTIVISWSSNKLPFQQQSWLG